jgi:hypothetical protein
MMKIPHSRGKEAKISELKNKLQPRTSSKILLRYKKSKDMEKVEGLQLG